MTALRVLLVDDDQSFLRETEALLSSHRYSVHTAGNFANAAGIVSRYRGRLVVLSELRAGGESGIAFLKETLKKYPSVPFTFLASAPPLESVIEALKQGAYDFLRKPVAPDILCHSVARSVEKLNLSLETEKREREGRTALAGNMAALRELEKLNEFKSFLISMAAHDIKSLVTVLDGYRQVLADQCSGCTGAVPAELVSQVARAITRLQRMTSTLLDYEAAERGVLRICSAPFDLDALIAESVAFYGPYARQKKVSLEIEPPLPSIMARGDAERLMEVLDNLFYNAVKFTPPGGEIRVGARVDGEKAVVWIRDTGVGIPDEQLKRLNAKELAPQKADPGSRMGLGIRICRRLIESHGGRLELQSNEGRGTVVSFSLPV